MANSTTKILRNNIKTFREIPKWVEENNVIVHYLGRNKPWKPDYKGILKPFYDKYKID